MNFCKAMGMLAQFGINQPEQCHTAISQTDEVVPATQTLTV